MGGDHRQHRPLRQRLRRRAGQRCPLLWVGAGHQLVEQHQRRTGGGRVQDLADVRQVTGEGRQIAEHRLPIADVGPHGVEEPDPTPRRRRHQQPSARHQRRQPDRLHEHRLAARVGPADDQDPRPGSAQRDVVGDDRAGAAGVGQRQQRVARLPEIDNRRLGDLDRRAAIADPQAGRRGQRVERGEHGGARAQRRRRHRDVGRQRFEDSARLAPDVELDHLEPVVGGDQRRRLDEHGLAGARGVVHDAEAERLGARLERQHEPLGADREELILQHGLVLLRSHEPLDRPPRVLRQPLALLAQARELRRRRVADLARGVEGGADRPGQPARRIEPRRQRRDLGDCRPAPARPQQRAPRPLGQIAQHGDRAQLVGPEDDRLLRGGHRRLDLGRRQRRQRLAGLEHPPELRHRRHPPRGLRRVARQREIETERPPRRRLRLGAEPLAKLTPVEDLQETGIHRGSPRRLARPEPGGVTACRR